ncbi:hypothetical protein INT08_02865 [Prosthecochloris sp. N3]|uniref:Uncharacterized protein n=1 Tax=Prosthecochloris ethylica TaxID=2743976 RepID=A0ABR9XQ56_9CHLB|nr:MULTISPECIES: hypothetical protein [Prosthecochloris]MEC9485888.1 hypothetical protein [Prosthecochloris sp.]MBF0586512.1 hypothetical protein [Prosthecochloris ethylica]MBF0636125.1 hypothetical protein [Prosthecochloris ethylica]NUK47738.1 hypothetical protein [Prosthecochloris ethylica]RNA64399.1 hypothetical protein CR163_003560 [Prosthecochloris sp. ZM_2]
MFPGGCTNVSDTETSSISGQSARQGLIEPCELITREDAERILGEPVLKGERSEQEAVGLKLCMYNPVDTNSWGFLQVALTQSAFMPENGLPPSDIFFSIRDAMSETRQDLEGLGDSAFIATGGLYLLKDEYYISIGAGNIDRPDVQERLKRAGKQALERLELLL